MSRLYLITFLSMIVSSHAMNKKPCMPAPMPIRPHQPSQIVAKTKPTPCIPTFPNKERNRKKY